MVDTLAATQLAMQAKRDGNSSEALTKLEKMIFGPRSEKTSVVLAKLGKKSGGKDSKSQEGAGSESSDRPKRRGAEKGHGRNGAAAYTGARRVKVPHPTLFTGAPCPQDDCEDGKMYRFFEPKTLVRIEGAAPLSACIYELEQWRCHLCLTLVSAPGGILKGKTPVARAVHEVILSLAANAPFLFNDDTGARILEMTRKERGRHFGRGRRSEADRCVYHGDRRQGWGARDRALLHRPALRRGAGAHGALPYYNPTEETDQRIEPYSLYRNDSGAQWLSTWTEPLSAGMILSNEAGYYKSGEYGIRIENLMHVVRREVTGAEPEMLGFEMLTLVPNRPEVDRRDVVDPGRA